MNKDTRNALRSVVGQCRRLLEKAVTDALQGHYGIHPTGEVEDAAKLTHLAGDEREYRSDLVAHLDHIQALGYTPKNAHEQLVREIAFTHLNRLCAYKMMEVREVWVGGQRFREAVSRGVKSQGFQFYLAKHEEDKHHFDAGRQEIAYRHFLQWLGGVLSDEIGVLFSPNDPANRLFPPQRVLDDVLDLLNGKELADIWDEDEAIGWVYQYFTPKEQRDQARKASAAPRNSYELAFRNQFFTPRYVVEFLTDNTLGRIWYEMRQGGTKLKDRCRHMVRRPTEVFLAEGQPTPATTEVVGERLSQDALLKLPVYVPFRAKKDPRDLRILDPACGSGHFLLYCFDLLLTIYEEAYADPDLGPTLKAEYPTLDALRRDVPRLILAYNLHGIDIDLRATQIAALALWLRCQRAYKEMGVKGDRPKTSRTNIVCAEPMPGEKNLLREFVTHEIGNRPEGKLLGQLVEDVFDKMKSAGEVGSLLKIDEDLRDAVHEARRQFQKGGLYEQQTIPGFGVDDDRRGVRRYAVKKLPDEQFFEQAEEKVVEALREYAEKAHAKERLQRRLFADDAVQGFAFIEMCHRRFDVVLMNPPFGEPSKPSRPVVDQQYPLTKNDLYAAFVECGINRLKPDGKLGAITSRTGFYLSSFQKWREEVLLPHTTFSVLADFGQGVLDGAMVEAAAYCFGLGESHEASLFVRLLQAENKQDALMAALQAVRSDRPTPEVFFVPPADFAVIPGSPFAYWVSDRIRLLFRDLPAFDDEDNGRATRCGLGTTDNFRFLRLNWEVPASTRGTDWLPYYDGGVFSPVYDLFPLVVWWRDNGREIKDFIAGKFGSASRNVRGEDFYRKPGFIFPRRTRGLCPKVMAPGGIFSNAGQAGFVPDSELLAAIGFLSSDICSLLISLSQGRTGDAAQFEVGLVKRLPWVDLQQGGIGDRLASLATDIYIAKRRSFRGDEVSYDFVAPLGLLYDGNSLAERIAHAQSDLLRLSAGVEHSLGEINSVVLEAYKIDPEDRLALADSSDAGDIGEDGEINAEPMQEDPPLSTGPDRFVADILSYAAGCVFGRWDVRAATGRRLFEALPDPFSPLPTYSPGMLVGGKGLRATAVPSDYPLQIDYDGIIPDDPDHAEDIVGRVRGVLELLFTTRANDIEDEVCDILGVGELRDYFRKPGKNGFWANHLARYSKSRRKAPIYWLLQSSDQNYGLWVYYHRLNKDTLFKALQSGGPLQTKIKLEQNRLDHLRSKKVTSGESGKGVKMLDKDIEKKELLVAELQDFEEKLRRAANLAFGKGLDSGVVYDPDPNDGVVLNIAPLWELVPWKEAKGYWGDLTAGDYEWSSMGKLLRKKGLVKLK